MKFRETITPRVQQRRTKRHLLAAPLLAVTMLAGACGNGDDQDEDVLSLSTVDSETTSSGIQLGLQPSEAVLDFSECVREEGLEFPDVKLTSSNEIDLGDLSSDVDLTDPAIFDATQKCGPILSQAGLGDLGERASVAVEDGIVELSQCLRDEGQDVADLTLEQAGSNIITNQFQTQTSGANEAGGSRELGFGSADDFIAAAYGLDSEDPEVLASIGVCKEFATNIANEFDVSLDGS